MKLKSVQGPIHSVSTSTTRQTVHSHFFVSPSESHFILIGGTSTSTIRLLLITIQLGDVLSGGQNVQQRLLPVVSVSSVLEKNFKHVVDREDLRRDQFQIFLDGQLGGFYPQRPCLLHRRALEAIPVDDAANDVDLVVVQVLQRIFRIARQVDDMGQVMFTGISIFDSSSRYTNI